MNNIHELYMRSGTTRIGNIILLLSTTHLQIPAGKDVSAKDRYEKIKKSMVNQSLKDRFNVDVIPHGSYAIGTETLYSDRQDFDIDAIVAGTPGTSLPLLKKSIFDY